MIDKASGAKPSEIVDAASAFSLDDLCNACHVEVEWVAELAQHGIIEPAGRTRSEWKFSSLSVVRVAKAKRLERDLGLNAAGIALVLELLREVEGLRTRLSVLQEMNADVPDETA
jgi:chaperone modulatory protein CbpM